MKIIITSNGQFNVTNALYESIKKNNPELLEAMNIPSKNMLAIAKIYKDITGNDIDKSNESEILSLYLKNDSDINRFREALKKDQGKKDNKNNKNNKNIENEKNQNNIENEKNQNQNQNQNQNNINIDDKELAERIKNLMSLYITNDTISYLNKLCHNSIENSVDNNSPKNKCLKKVRNMIEDKTNDIKELTSLLNSGNTKNETERKGSFLYDIIKNLERKAKTEEDKGIKTRALENRLNDNDKNKILNRMKDNIAIKIRESILGIEEQDNDMRKIVDSDENVQEKIYNKWFNNHIDLLLNTNNLLRYLSDNEWNNIEKTLDYPFDKSSVKTSEESVREYIGHIKDTVNKVTFESEIPHSVTNLIEKINSGMSGKVFKTLPFLKISKFGEKRIDFLTKELKEFYCDLTKNEGEVLRGYKMIDLYRVIPANDFWKNAIVYNCYTQETYQLVLSYIQRQYRKGEVEMSMNPVATGLKARSTIFSVKPITDNPNEKIVDRVNKQKFDNISSKDKEIIKKIKRYYFIVVTEGLVQKGAILSKMADKIKNGLSRKNSLFGIDTSGNHLN